MAIKYRTDYFLGPDEFSEYILKYTDIQTLLSYFHDGPTAVGNFCLWRCRGEYFIMEISTMIVISWFKELGRRNRASCDMTLQEFNNFCKKLGNDIKEDKHDY